VISGICDLIPLLAELNIDWKPTMVACMNKFEHTLNHYRSKGIHDQFVAFAEFAINATKGKAGVANGAHQRGAV
jgi:hypothetical protein